LTFNAGTLSANTTYFVRVGALFNGATVYATPSVSSATLTDFITTYQYFQVNVTSVVVNWESLSGLGGSEGYELDASTSSDFVPVFRSSVTDSVDVSTLTLQNLNAYTTYYFRVGGINWNNMVNYTSLASTQTLAGGPPVTPHLTGVFISSMAVSWTDTTDTSGYDIEASLTDFGGLVASSSTADVARSSLTFNAGTLSANTTYFVRVGALFNGATVYATPSVSSATLTDFITTYQFYQVNVTSVVVNWESWSGLGGSEGYELDASTSSDFVPGLRSSVSDSVNVSTLTIQNLNAYTTYYFRVGGINWNNVVNYTSLA
jgi:hypothetical protein